jgi:crotonobetainyl-CoA:carnitine CoA-transferase CaiB-like acyl-CoA transferase
MPTLSGLSVVEVRCGTGALGAAITTALPAALLANAGAEVTVIQTDGYDDTFDEVSGSPKCWDHSKRVEAGRWSSPGFRREAHSAVAAADVVLFAGARSGRVFQELANDGDAPDGWVVVDCQASDWEIIVQARCGLTSLVAGEHLEPTYTAVPMAGYGTALTVYCAALSILYVKDGPARPQLCFSTTMAEGLVATQAMLLRTVEKPRIPLGPISTQRWQYQCADGTWVHLNLVPAGAQQGFRDVLAELGADGRAQGLDFRGGDDDPLVRTLLGCTDSVTLLGLLSRHAVPGQPVLSPARAFADLDFARNDLVHPRQGSPGSIGRASRVESADGTAVRGASRWSEGSLPLTGITVVDAGAYARGRSEPPCSRSSAPG